MEYTSLGPTGIPVSRIGLGCWAFGGHGYGAMDYDASFRTIRRALDLGVTFFDTADVYGFGRSEEILGKALGLEAKKVIVATKFGVKWDSHGNTNKDCSPSRVRPALEASLRRLRMDCIPLYQIHWYDDRSGLDEVMATLGKCRDEGKIKHIGCSNFTLPLVQEALRHGSLESFQREYNVNQRSFEKEIEQVSIKSRMTVLAYRVLGRGLFSGKYGENSVFGPNDTRARDTDFEGVRLQEGLRVVRRLKEVADQLGKSPSQVAIRWVLDNPFVGCALVGAKSPEQIEENAGIFGWRMESDQLATSVPREISSTQTNTAFK